MNYREPAIEELELNRMIFRGFPEDGIRSCFFKLVRHPLRYFSIRTPSVPEPTIGMQHCSLVVTFVRGSRFVESVQIYRGMQNPDGKLVPYSHFGECEEMKYWQSDDVGMIHSTIFSVRDCAIKHPLNGLRYHPLYCNDWLWARQFVNLVSDGKLSIDHLCPKYVEQEQRTM